ncbi:hypothetical protein [Flavobacterium foetidum]|uniref:hypothetical protein n=1 Tax=Flavobacterium foetidum TaxID=2026681 RepID=UPI001074D3AD|nr:hypothetical protein [Flavobacterium foetidum]KAF2515620.1 hypothetical protein E0W73_08485 [Flavobacterium foetidum]
MNSFFEMNESNQKDLLDLISSLKLNQKKKGNLVLSIPEGTQTYWKTEMKKYSFVEWIETFDQVCIRYEQPRIISANVPDKGNINQSIPIKIKFEVLNGCGGFGTLSEVNSGNTKTIEIKAKYEGCYCNQSIENIETTYNFIPSKAGTHIIKLLQPTGDFLTYSINIQ